ncbi:U32 family peptidase [Ruegeria sp. 6PALISEP08]|uniref:ubiquinone anaerobic biosynthesis protein UbiV n=1 Tax=Ruegeria sp. 6PALISEP08 TaxID=1225660 RepID=UPI00067ECF1A|nr:U32 family peptidase [Ruegeria sp. 6PALISEP08]
MELTVGPNQFFWSAERWESFYSDLTQSTVDRVVIGELVCSKRLPFYQDRIPEAVSRLLDAGKEVTLTTLALVTLKRELKLTAELADMGVMVEINDLTALAYIPNGCAFSVGPLVNVYNESTVNWLASRGARRICLPPELPVESVKVLAQAAKDKGVAIEVWGHGRLPLAISGRCYHARLNGRSKDNCQFACEDDPDGLDVVTSDGVPIMAMNGVQTLSDSYACTDHQIDLLRDAGVSALRLSPQADGFLELCDLYRRRVDGVLAQGELGQAMRDKHPDIRLSDGFLTGRCGAEWSGTSDQPSKAP